MVSKVGIIGSLGVVGGGIIGILGSLGMIRG